MAGGTVDPITLSMMRFLIGGALLMLAGAMLFRKRLLVSVADLARLALLGAFGVAGMSLFFFFGQKTVSAITGALIMQTSPIMIYFFSIFIGERLTLKGVAGILISLLGCLFVIGVFNGGGYNGLSGQAYGVLAIFLSALCWAIYSVAGKKLVLKYGGFITTAWAMVFGAIEISLLWLFLPFERAWPVSTASWWIVAYIAVFPTAVAFLAWYESMERIPLSLLNVMKYLTPVFVIILAWSILGENMGAANLTGAALVLGGVALIAKSEDVFLKDVVFNKVFKINQFLHDRNNK